MILKDSAEKTSTIKPIGDDLNYTFDYEYDSEKYAHRLLRAGDRHYKYDANGNIVEEKEGAFDEAGGEKYHKINVEADDVYSTDYGWGLFREKESVKNSERYHRTYTWNEKNQLVSTSDARYTVNYVYGQDGQRAAKYTAQSETLYFNKMWTLHTDGGNSHLGGEYAKNVYLGETRIVTKLVSANEIRAWEEVNKIYFYHSDHLGSASLITDENGNEYQRLEYTPYGEVWVDKYSQIQESTALLPYKFTGKERDEETGLYYFGARYLDAKYSRWISTDPALGDYIPKAPINDEAKKHNQNLPGMGGLFNTVNMNLYHYAGNNPIKYTDPTGKWTLTITINATAGAGAEGTAGVGIAFGFSFKKGFSMGLVETHSIGAQQGASANVSVAVGFDPVSKSVESGKTESLTIGGSGDMPVGAGIGGDVSVDLESGNVSYSANLSFGVGTPGEAHELYTTTNTITVDDLADKIYRNMTPQGIMAESGKKNLDSEEK